MASAREFRSYPPGSAGTLWEAVTDIGEVGRWFPGVTACTVDGDTRTLTLANGASVTERILAREDEATRLEYEIVGGDLPVESHRATIDVLDLDDRVVVVFGVDVEPAKRLKLFTPTLAPALQGLAALVDGR